MSGKAGEIVVGDVLGHDFPGGVAVLSDGHGSESGGCNVPDQVQADRRPIRGAKSLGLRVAQVTSPPSLLPHPHPTPTPPHPTPPHPPTAVRECADGFLLRRHTQMLGLFLWLQAAELSR